MSTDTADHDASFQLWAAAIGAFIIYTIWYLTRAVNKPRVYGGRGGIQKQLLENCAIFSEHFWPTFWCFESRLQTLARSLFKLKPKVPYRRELLDTPDGGIVSLDWLDHHIDDSQKPQSPIILMLPGLTGDSCDSYMAFMSLEVKAHNFRVCVFNNRGNGGVPLKTPKLFCANFTDDLALVVDLIHKKFPDAPIIGCGVSLGGMILFNYLAKNPDSPLSAGVTFSMPWCCERSSVYLEHGFNYFFFNRQLTRLMIKNLLSHSSILSNVIDVNEIKTLKSIRDIDNKIVCRMFGYRDSSHYYSEASPRQRFDKIKHPLVCINAADDVFSLEHTIPVSGIDQLEDGPMLVLTSHGGHIGFLEGMIPLSRSYSDRMFSEVIKTLVDKYGKKA